MHDDQEYEPWYEEPPESEAIPADVMAQNLSALKRMNLAHSIKSAFTTMSAVQLRRWYVETFVLDQSNLDVLPDVRSTILADFHKSDTWISREHSIIGSRLLYAMDPDTIAKAPDFVNTEMWTTEDGLVQILMRIIEPWNQIRFDPAGENWYTAIHPGQWLRHGKGNPGRQAVEAKITKWIHAIDPKVSMDPYKPWPPTLPEGMSTETFTGRVGNSVKAFKKFKTSPTARGRIREALERELIMQLDPSTINQVKSVAPFSNGALNLVTAEYKDTMNRDHWIYPGELLPMHIEYMVTNANPLPWTDRDKIIPGLMSMPEIDEGEFGHLMEHQDDLLLDHCPTYWAFLSHAFPGVPERKAFLRLLGAAMFGRSLKIVAAMIGEPNAGKDTVMNWLSYLMPGQVATLPFSAFTPYGEEDRGFAPLLGARVAAVSGEVGEGRGSKLLAEKIKTVSSGGGRIRVAEKYEKPTDIWFDGMLFLQGNSVPQIAGGDTALYTNRLVAVEFKHPFALTAKSYEDAYRHEAPWFAQVLFIHYLKYEQFGGGMPGINPPPSWRAFAKDFADAANPHGFLEACIVPSDTPIPTHLFHQALSAMVERFGSPMKVGPNFWPKRIRAMGFSMKAPSSIRRVVTIAGTQTWCYYLTIDSDKSDGSFTQAQWEAVLKDAAVTS